MRLQTLITAESQRTQSYAEEDNQDADLLAVLSTLICLKRATGQP